MTDKRPGDAELTRFTLGTAQLGMTYGINNHTGQPSLTDAGAIIGAAWQGGIHEFDTAQGYGNSEEVLGSFFSALAITEKVRVISKLDPSLDMSDPQVLEKALGCSLKRLRITKLSGLMLHHEKQLDGWSLGLGAWLKEKREGGSVDAIGASFYSPMKALAALEMDEIQFIQIPANILDRRCEAAGVFQRAATLKKTIYIRSVFLQGLLLMSPGALSAGMSFASEPLQKACDLAKRLNLSMDELCMGYVIHRWPSARILFGAETPTQVLRNLALGRKSYPEDIVERVEGELNGFAERVVDPTMWPR